MMKRIWRSLVCAFKGHDWQFYVINRNTYDREDWMECTRCEKVKDVNRM